MAPLDSRSNDITLEEKVLICLKTLGSGSFQNCSKDFVQVSQPSVSKILTSISDSMVKLAPTFIFMPPTCADIFETKHNFYEVAGFPGVIGCIDGSHIPIVAPSSVARGGGGADGGGGGGYSPPPIGLSTKMQNKKNTTFLALLRLFFCAGIA